MTINKSTVVGSRNSKWICTGGRFTCSSCKNVNDFAIETPNPVEFVDKKCPKCNTITEVVFFYTDQN